MAATVPLTCEGKSRVPAGGWDRLTSGLSGLLGFHKPQALKTAPIATGAQALWQVGVKVARVWPPPDAPVTDVLTSLLAVTGYAYEVADAQINYLRQLTPEKRSELVQAILTAFPSESVYRLADLLIADDGLISTEEKVPMILHFGTSLEAHNVSNLRKEIYDRPNKLSLETKVTLALYRLVDPPAPCDERYDELLVTYFNSPQIAIYMKCATIHNADFGNPKTSQRAARVFDQVIWPRMTWDEERLEPELPLIAAFCRKFRGERICGAYQQTPADFVAENLPHRLLIKMLGSGLLHGDELSFQNQTAIANDQSLAWDLRVRIFGEEFMDKFARRS
ncbi:MAG: hypothetical protein NT099_08935 [Candidatus Saganbacteria bacterium]|nr:hypothetical protein [Candidatus Saganbacteria bacterium]